MFIKSLRFGDLEVPDDRVITMERPVLGFEKLRTFCLVEMEELTPFYWLQSTDEPAVAFLVCNPLVFFPDYRIEINSQEIAELTVHDVKSVETYVIVTIPDDGKEISANLQGPILINNENGRAKQLVLVNSDYDVRHPLLTQDEREQAIETEEPQPVGV